MKARLRDYNSLLLRLEALPARVWKVGKVGTVWRYPWVCVERSVRQTAPTILLTGGMHGEEPGGVEGVLQWLEGDGWQDRPVNWLVLPCINPYGWERNQRGNAQRRDINRQFRYTATTPEAELIKRLLRGRRFLFSMEFHEDVDASGYYLYEMRRSPPLIGERIVRSVAQVIPINPNRMIDGQRITGKGLIRRDPDFATLSRRRRWPMAYHLFLNNTDHILGSETPVNAPLEQRTRAHIVALMTALNHVESLSASTIGISVRFRG